MGKRVGVLALQGDTGAHVRMLAAIHADAHPVRTPPDLAGLDAMILPGGESTTMSLLLDSTGLREPLREIIAGGLPVLATCAGVILLTRDLARDSGSVRVETLHLLDARVSRNAYGRQVDSFEAEISIDWPVLDRADDNPGYHGVFIRAPGFSNMGSAVEQAGRLGDEPVLLRQGNILAAAFHPELTGDTRLHEALVGL